MKKILIAGDSFAADWTKKYSGVGWVNMLERDYDVTNVAEAGVSEYKIYKQIKNIKVNQYDTILISHTSPFRIPVKTHPLHENDLLHNNCDLIYSDLKQRENNQKIKPIIDFFENYFYEDYFIFTHELIINQIKLKLPNAIHISFFDLPQNNVINFNKYFLKYNGNMNHLNEKGNKIVYNKIKKLIDEK